MSLAALLLLWNLSIPAPFSELMIAGGGDAAITSEQQAARPARLPPLSDNGWSPER